MTQHKQANSASFRIGVVVTFTILSLALSGCSGPKKDETSSVDATHESTAPAPTAAQTPETTEVAAEPMTSEGPLAGTHWQLVQIQSMDDAIGTTTPEDPSVYTMDLNADGTAAFQLNCNRGTTTWQSETSEAGTSGTFTLGPLAMTRALCPPPSLDEHFAKDSEFLRSFVLQDGKLHLSLMADGGVYTWEPYVPTTE